MVGRVLLRLVGERIDQRAALLGIEAVLVLLRVEAFGLRGKADGEDAAALVGVALGPGAAGRERHQGSRGQRAKLWEESFGWVVMENLGRLGGARRSRRRQAAAYR